MEGGVALALGVCWVPLLAPPGFPPPCPSLLSAPGADLRQLHQQAPLPKGHSTYQGGPLHTPVSFWV